jgi:hypothetical protein
MWDCEVVKAKDGEVKIQDYRTPVGLRLPSFALTTKRCTAGWPGFVV